jgi:phosphatidylinositol alpha-mannosyltransferase
MAAGTAIVASDLTGYRHVARAGQEALLVEPGDADALRDALARLLGDPNLRDTLVADGRRRAGEFSMSRLAAAFIDRYESVARDHTTATVVL